MFADAGAANGDPNFLSSSGSLNESVDYGFLGLQTPYAPPAQRAFQDGSTVPLTWQYTDFTGAVISSSTAASVVRIDPSQCVSGVDGAPIVAMSSGSSGYQYDSISNTWQFNWKTTGLPVGCYNIRVGSGLTNQTNGPFPIQLR